MSESETGSAPPASWTYATRSPSSAAQTGATWLCSEQQTTGMPAEVLGELARLLDVHARVLHRRVRQHHHVRALLGRQLEPARQIRVEHVETAGAELELARLRR